MKYIWRAKDGDHIVEVIKILGKGSDGLVYVQIEGSNTGIPFNELKPFEENPKNISKKPPKRS
jgi:hypothetical protein